MTEPLVDRMLRGRAFCPPFLFVCSNPLDFSSPSRIVSGIPASARPHHWGFAHAWLRRSFERLPETIVAAIARARSAAPVVDAWQNFGRTLDDAERLAADGLEASSYVSPSETGDWYLAVVSFPPPEHPEEVHFAALCVRPPDGELRPGLREEAGQEGPRAAGLEEDDRPSDSAEGRPPEPEADLRYILLERIDPGETRLVEWEHSSREQLAAPSGADSPAADEQSFVRAVGDLLE